MNSWKHGFLNLVSIKFEYHLLHDFRNVSKEYFREPTSVVQSDLEFRFWQELQHHFKHNPTFRNQFRDGFWERTSVKMSNTSARWTRRVPFYKQAMALYMYTIIWDNSEFHFEKVSYCGLIAEASGSDGVHTRYVSILKGLNQLCKTDPTFNSSIFEIWTNFVWKLTQLSKVERLKVKLSLLLSKVQLLKVGVKAWLRKVQISEAGSNLWKLKDSERTRNKC